MPESNLIIYNVPSRTGSNVEVETIAKLARHPQIVGVKESSGDLSQLKRIIDQTDKESFHVLTGECHQISETIAMGGFGAISATANLAPRLLVRIASSAFSGEAALARTLQDEAQPLVKAVFSAKNPIPLAMLFSSHLRLPLLGIPELLPQLKILLRNYSVSDLGVDLSEYEALPQTNEKPRNNFSARDLRHE